MLDLITKLVNIPSVSSNQDACKNVLDTVAQLFTNVPGIIIEPIENDGIHSLMVKNFDGKRADIGFNGHVDVVPPQDESQRQAAEKDGFLRGRGCGDMKDGVVIISTLMHDLCKNLLTDKKLILILTADEEIGGKNGAAFLADEGYGADIVLIPDGGSDKQIIIGEKGLINLTLEATGHAGHSSKPRLYDNAIEKLLAAYTQIKETIETPALYEEPDHRGCSVQLTTIQGGQVSNMIPEHASGTINIRYTEEATLERVMKRIEVICQNLGGLKATVQSHGSVLHTDPRHRTVLQYLEIAKTFFPEIALGKEHGASDGRYFAEHGALVILHKPTCFDIHGRDERTTIAELETTYKIYKQFVCTV